jgi:hypothetical protein
MIRSSADTWGSGDIVQELSVTCERQKYYMVKTVMVIVSLARATPGYTRKKC